MEVLDKSAIFCPDADYDKYFTFWLGTTSGEFKTSTIWGFYNGRYVFLHIPRLRIPILHCFIYYPRWNPEAFEISIFKRVKRVSLAHAGTFSLTMVHGRWIKLAASLA